MALGSQLENNQIALLVKPAHISKNKPHPLRRPPNNKRSLKRLLRNARLAPLPAKQRPLNHEISRKEKTPIISQPIKKVYRELPCNIKTIKVKKLQYSKVKYPGDTLVFI